MYYSVEETSDGISKIASQISSVIQVKLFQYRDYHEEVLISVLVIRKYPKLVDLLNQCWKVEPHERGSSYADFISQLQTIGSDIGRPDRKSERKSESWNKNEFLPLKRDEGMVYEICLGMPVPKIGVSEKVSVTKNF